MPLGMAGQQNQIPVPSWPHLVALVPWSTSPAPWSQPVSTPIRSPSRLTQLETSNLIIIYKAAGAQDIFNKN